MRYINKLTMLLAVTVFTLAACHKVQDLPFYENGTPVSLSASSTNITPVAGDSLNNVVTFTWSDPKYATDSAHVKFILEVDSTGRNFSKSVTKTVIGNQQGTALTGKELNAILLNYGFTVGSPYELDVRVYSSYLNNNERYLSNVIKLTVTPYNDPSVLTADQTSLSPTLATASQKAITFSWSPAFNGYSGNVTYVLQYDSATKNFANIREIEAGTNVFSTDITEGVINETALNVGIAGGTTGTVEYRLKATTAHGAVSYSNAFSVSISSYVPILRFYLPGSYQVATGYGPNDWTPETAPELIRDVRPEVFNHIYYIYIWLPAGAQFKVTEGRSWATNYGGTGGNLVQNSPDNLSVGAAGVYRITIDRVTMKYDIKIGRMGFVGGGTGAGWTPPNVFPTYQMGAPATNLFVGLVNLTADQWKMIDNDEWNGGGPNVQETRSYGTNSPSGSTMEINTPNNFLAVPTPGRYRVMWDGRDVDNIKYHLTPATEMRIAGDGIDEPGVGSWDPPTSPQMTYSGNGVWTITVKLHADKFIKFVAGNAWGAFDYEDNSGGNNAIGVDRPIKWEGSGDFKTPSVAGTYTITLNEHTQTMRID